MEVSNNTNNFQAMNQYQMHSGAKPANSIQPVPQEPTYNDKEVYEGSQGNVHRNGDNELALTPQAKTNINNTKEDNAAEASANDQANKDAQRENATNLLAHKSKQSQVEIYLAVATEGNDSPVDNNTAQIIESLRDVQKQNNAVEAYATYKTNQDAPVNNMTRGLAG